MAKSGTPRHSKPARNPVTINLDPSDVKRADAPASDKTTIHAAEPVGDFAKSAAPANGPQISSTTSAGESAAPRVSEAASKTGTATNAEKPASRPPFASTQPSSAPKVENVASRGSGSMFLAGVAGGIIALAGAAALQWGNVIPSPGARVTAEQLARIEQEIASLHISPPPAPMDDASSQRLAKVEKATAETSSALAALQQAVQDRPVISPENSGDVEALKERLATLESGLASTQSQAQQMATAASSDSSTISELQSKLTALQESVTDNARQPDAAALIAVNALKTAVDRGGSFVAELDTYAPLAPKDGATDTLRNYASKGIPTVADLNAWFAPVADKIVATANKLPDDAGIIDQLMASAKGLVNVRPVGDVSGDGVGPVTARIESALHAGDLERGLAEWEQLPADAKAVSREFADQMKARRDADALVARLVAESLKPRATASEPTAN